MAKIIQKNMCTSEKPLAAQTRSKPAPGQDEDDDPAVPARAHTRIHARGLEETQQTDSLPPKAYHLGTLGHFDASWLQPDCMCITSMLKTPDPQEALELRKSARATIIVCQTAMEHFFM